MEKMRSLIKNKLKALGIEQLFYLGNGATNSKSEIHFRINKSKADLCDKEYAIQFEELSETIAIWDLRKRLQNNASLDLYTQSVMCWEKINRIYTQEIALNKKKKNKHQLEIDPEAAAIVREIFDMRIAGVGLTEIARNLNDRGIKCPSVYKTEKGEASNHTENAENMCWTASGVLQLLSNEIYTGAVVALKSTFDTVTGKLKVKPKEEWSKVEGMHEAIVSKEVFQKAQEMITPQKAPSETRKQHYICGCCGRGLNRRNGTDLYCARGYFLEDDCECRVPCLA